MAYWNTSVQTFFLPQTESKSQTLNTYSSSLKVVRLSYLSSADAALSAAVFYIEIS